jgi:hypothetical protein
MSEFSSNSDDERLAIPGPNDERLTLPQLLRIEQHFARRATVAVDVQVEYDEDNDRMVVTGLPAPGVSPQRAEVALQDAIAAAEYMHPASNLDMSA